MIQPPTNANTLRWKCSERGCFNEVARPKIEYFDDCFPGNIKFGDVDACVEIAGNFLYLEWKGRPIKPSGGQKILSERRTAGGESTVFYVVGDAKTMNVTHLAVCYRGKWGKLEACTFERLHQRISSFARWAKAHPQYLKPLADTSAGMMNGTRPQRFTHIDVEAL